MRVEISPLRLDYPKTYVRVGGGGGGNCPWEVKRCKISVVMSGYRGNLRVLPPPPKKNPKKM